MNQENDQKAGTSPGGILNPGLNIIPPHVHRVHLMGVCGTGMASLAGLLKGMGFLVTGSDRNVYPPMSDFLRTLGIPILEGYQAENLSSRPDLVIVGNVITRDNPEAVELARLGIPYQSMPQALRRYAIGDSRSIAVCGTHGKTTTSSLAAWVLEKAGLDPGFMIGGIPANFQANFKQGRGEVFVVEGDEYDTAFFDKGPKFLHYAPWIAVLTGIEYDHADIYRDLDHVLSSFRALISTLPRDGLLIANADDPRVAEEVGGAPCQVVTYGLENQADWTLSNVSTADALTHADLHAPGGETIHIATPLYGGHNLSNLLAVSAVAGRLKIPARALQEACLTFAGVRRRQEVRGEAGGVLVIDDFAHHPTAVRETIRAVRERYAGRRILAVFEPRSNSSRRNIFQKDYAGAFDHAHLAFIAEPPLMDKIPPPERFSSGALVEDLSMRGIEAYYGGGADSLLEEIAQRALPGDVVLVMSNGSFDNLHERLLKRLEHVIIHP